MLAHNLHIQSKTYYFLHSNYQNAFLYTLLGTLCKPYGSLCGMPMSLRCAASVGATNATVSHLYPYTTNSPLSPHKSAPASLSPSLDDASLSGSAPSECVERYVSECAAVHKHLTSTNRMEQQLLFWKLFGFYAERLGENDYWLKHEESLLKPWLVTASTQFTKLSATFAQFEPIITHAGYQGTLSDASVISFHSWDVEKCVNQIVYPCALAHELLYAMQVLNNRGKWWNSETLASALGESLKWYMLQLALQVTASTQSILKLEESLSISSKQTDLHIFHPHSTLLKPLTIDRLRYHRDRALVDRYLRVFESFLKKNYLSLPVSTLYDVVSSMDECKYMRQKVQQAVLLRVSSELIKCNVSKQRLFKLVHSKALLKVTFTFPVFQGLPEADLWGDEEVVEYVYKCLVGGMHIQVFWWVRLFQCVENFRNRTTYSLQTAKLDSALCQFFSLETARINYFSRLLLRVFWKEYSALEGWTALDVLMSFKGPLILSVIEAQDFRDHKFNIKHFDPFKLANRMYYLGNSLASETRLRGNEAQKWFWTASTSFIDTITKKCETMGSDALSNDVFLLVSELLNLLYYRVDFFTTLGVSQGKEDYLSTVAQSFLFAL